MKKLLFLITLLVLFSCSPPTKQEAKDYFGKIRYEICNDVLVQLSTEWNLVKTYTNDPQRLIDGPNSEEFALMSNAQTQNMSDLRACLEKLEKLDPLGDEANYLESIKMYLYTYLRFEEEVMVKFIKKLEGGMNPEEMSFVKLYTGRLIDLYERQDELLSAEEQFIKEFNISDKELDNLVLQYT